MPNRMPDKGSQRRFDDPISLPRGRQLVTLEDAAGYIMKLPKAEPDLEDGKPIQRRGRQNTGK
jgi:hypothetical protein